MTVILLGFASLGTTVSTRENLIIHTLEPGMASKVVSVAVRWAYLVSARKVPP